MYSIVIDEKFVEDWWDEEAIERHFSSGTPEHEPDAGS
jgi:hypothetical protein